MVRRPPTRSSILIAAALLVALVGWTWLTFAFGPVQALDARLGRPAAGPAVPRRAGRVRVLAADLARRHVRRSRRDRHLGLPAPAPTAGGRPGLIIVATWGATELLKITFARPRPETGLDLISASGYAYPSGHLSSIVAGSIAVGATFAVTRQSVRARLRWQTGAGLLVLVVAVDQLAARRALRHRPRRRCAARRPDRDARAAGQRRRGAGAARPGHRDDPAAGRRAGAARAAERAAVIFNPTKVIDWVTFRRHVEYELHAAAGTRRCGWRPPPTTRGGR